MRSVFSDKSRNLNLGANRNNSVGMLDVNELLLRLRSVKLFKFAISLGMLDVMGFSFKRMNFNVESIPIVDVMLPTILFGS